VTGAGSKVITLCGDPGGASALVPVVELLQRDPALCVENYAYHAGAGVLGRKGVAFGLPPQSTDSEWPDRVLGGEPVAGLLTATSHNGVNWERRFIAAANRLGIPSLSVLDFWSNYTLRFSDESGVLGPLPDEIAIMDDVARVEMMAEGFPSERLVVTGQPAFDSLARERQGFSPTRKSELRSSLGLQGRDLLLVFVSQPLRSFCSGPGNPTHFGYDEVTVLTALVPALERIARAYPEQVTLMIRPHPREELAPYRRYGSEGIRILLSVEGDTREYLMASDLVLGMNSVALVEACVLGCAVVSLQPALAMPDPLPTNRWGWSIPVYSFDGIESTLEPLVREAVRRDSLRARTETFLPRILPGAAERIANHLRSRWFGPFSSAAKSGTRPERKRIENE